MFESQRATPQRRFSLSEAAHILRVTGATLSARARKGLIQSPKDGRRIYIAAAELERYIAGQG